MAKKKLIGVAQAIEQVKKAVDDAAEELRADEMEEFYEALGVAADEWAAALDDLRAEAADDDRRAKYEDEDQDYDPTEDEDDE